MQYARLIPGLSGLAFLVAALGAVPSAAQVPAGTIRGEVYDSLTAGPLVGAGVYIWNTTLRTTTDESGAFEFTGVPVGTHRVVFAHERLLELGISNGYGEAVVTAAAGATVSLATPSPFTVQSNTCLMEGTDSESAVAVGYVEDVESGVALPGARVHLTWHDELGSPHTLESTSNAYGWFRFCTAPTGRPLGVTARFSAAARVGGRRLALVALPGRRPRPGLYHGHARGPGPGVGR